MVVPVGFVDPNEIIPYSCRVYCSIRTSSSRKKSMQNDSIFLRGLLLWYSTQTHLDCLACTVSEGFRSLRQILAGSVPVGFSVPNEMVPRSAVNYACRV